MDFRKVPLEILRNLSINKHAYSTLSMETRINIDKRIDREYPPCTCGEKPTINNCVTELKSVPSHVTVNHIKGHVLSYPRNRILLQKLNCPIKQSVEYGIYYVDSPNGDHAISESEYNRLKELLT